MNIVEWQLRHAKMFFLAPKKYISFMKTVII